MSYGALKRQFGLDDAYLDDRKVALIDAQHLARDENGSMLAWISAAETPPNVGIVPESLFFEEWEWPMTRPCSQCAS